jgi:energy-coupling factor transporter ATP-binding protein EcfA2
VPPYPYLLNRNGHFYFRMALPLSLRPNFGQRELLYSLKTKDTSEAKRRSLAVLNALEGVLRDAHAEKVIAAHSLKEALSTLDFYQERKPSSSFAERISPTRDEGQATVSKVYEAYLLECKGDREKTTEKKKNVLALWQEIVGDLPLKAVNKERARHFKTVLMRLPVNMKQKYGDKPIKVINLDQIPEDERLSVSQGQRQDLALAIFLARARSLGGTFFLDEPFVHLDDLNKVALLDTLRVIVSEAPTQMPLRLVMTTASNSLLRHLREKFSLVETNGQPSVRVYKLNGNPRLGLRIEEEVVHSSKNLLNWQPGQIQLLSQ